MLVACVSTRPLRRYAPPGSAGANREVAGARTIAAPAARQRASAAAASVLYRGCEKASPVTARKRSAPEEAIWSAAACVAAPASPTLTGPPSASAALRASRAGLASEPSVSVCASTRIDSTLFLPHPRDDLPRNLFHGHVPDDARLSLLLRQANGPEAQSRVGDRRGLGLLQGRQDRAHVRHSDLRIVARLGEIPR